MLKAVGINKSRMIHCFCSRDTMVKVWSLANCIEVKSFGGHTGTVTSVILLTQEQSSSICKILMQPVSQISRLEVVGIECVTANEHG